MSPSAAINAIVDLHEPHGTAWELGIVIAAVILVPRVFERLRIPGLVGMLAAGSVVGPNVLGLISDADGIVVELGAVGLLYLMFLAGLELDLGVFAQVRRKAVIFALLTFVVPVAAGMAAGFGVGYGFAAALLLGSLFASYTLVVYPQLRAMGLSTNQAVAVGVGATVITDTLALIVLAAVAGSARGDASGAELALQIALGFAVLVVFCFVVLARTARWFFRGPGRGRSLRYLFVLASLLSGGVVAEVVGIEAIVGAFFAGLALNRLVPNEGEFMERVEFFGSTLLVPLFLVSVGTIIDPAVLVDPGTLALAGLFTLACVGGKLVAALLCRPLLQFSWDEIGVLFSLSVVQAAATLAATFVGLEIGLFSMSTVNAVMVVIVISMVVATAMAQRHGQRVPRPPVDTSRVGRSVLVQLEDPAEAGALLSLAGRLADRDGGVVRPVVVTVDGGSSPDEHTVHALEGAVERSGLDAELGRVVDASVSDALVHTAAAAGSSLVLVPAATQVWLPTLLGAAQHRLVATAPAPTALVRVGRAAPQRTVLVLEAVQATRPSSAAYQAAQVAVRLAGNETVLVITAGELTADLSMRLAGADVRRVAATHEWLCTEAGAADLLVVPGGRNGAMGTARVSKAASAVGATLVVVADRESVAPTERAGDAGGMIHRRLAPLP